MTIGIGLICNNGIVLASDSQTTRGAVKDLHAQKISVVDFVDGRIVVAQAGIADLSDGAIRGMARRAKEIALTPDGVMQIAVESIRDVRKHFWELDRLDRLSEQEVRAYFHEKDFTLLVGFYHERKPYLFTVDLTWCYPVESKRHYSTIGIGGYLADYIISEYAPEKVEFEDGYPLAVYAVEKVISNVDGCGPPTWVGITYPVPQAEIEIRMRAKTNRPIFLSEAVILPRLEIDPVALELRNGEESARNIQRDYIRKVMQSVTKKRLERINEEYQSLREDEIGLPPPED